MTIRFTGIRPTKFEKRVEEDLVNLQADIGEVFIRRVTGFRHPYKTGRLRASWRVKGTLSFVDVGPGQTSTIPTGRVKVVPFTISYVTNGVGYGGLVDQGIGMAYPRNFVRPAIKYTVRQFK